MLRNLLWRTIKDEEKYIKMSKKIYITEFDDFNDYPFKWKFRMNIKTLQSNFLKNVISEVISWFLYYKIRKPLFNKVIRTLF